MVDMTSPCEAIFRAAPLLRVVTRDCLVQLASAYLVAVMCHYEVVAPLEVDELVKVIKHLHALLFLVVHPKHLVEPQCGVRVVIASCVD